MPYLTTQQIYNLFKKKCFITDTSHIQPEYKISQQQILGLAYLKKLREEVVYNDKTLIIAGDGKHRSGKSCTAVFLACLWDKTFPEYFEQRVCHTPRAFKNAMNTIRKRNIHSGVIIIDEAGAVTGTDAFATKWMHAIQKEVMICGMWNPIIIFLSPQASFVDSKLRRMTHLYFKFARYNSKETIITPYEIHWNAIKQKFFYKKPKINFMGQEIVIRTLHIAKPPQEIIDKYRALEDIRKSKMSDEHDKEIQKDEIEERKDTLDINDVIDYVLENIKLFEAKNSKPSNVRLDEALIKYSFSNLKSKQEHYVKVMAERKIQEKIKDIQDSMERNEVG
jgi:hypothetical protein